MLYNVSRAGKRCTVCHGKSVYDLFIPALMKTHVVSHLSINHSLQPRIKTRIIELKLINARNVVPAYASQMSCII